MTSPATSGWLQNAINTAQKCVKRVRTAKHLCGLSRFEKCRLGGILPGPSNWWASCLSQLEVDNDVISFHVVKGSCATVVLNFQVASKVQ